MHGNECLVTKKIALSLPFLCVSDSKTNMGVDDLTHESFSVLAYYKTMFSLLFFFLAELYYIALIYARSFTTETP